MEDWKQLMEITQPIVEDDDIRKSQYHDPIAPWKPPMESTSSAIFHVDCDPDIFIHQQEEHNPTLIEVETCAEHVINVWEAIGSAISERLIDGLGTKIPGFGSFTYHVVDDTMWKKFWYKKPVLILSEVMLRMYKLKSASRDKISAIPIAGMNMKEIADSLTITQHIVDGVVTEVLQAFARAVVCGKNVEFPFPNLGKLQLSKGEVSFKFYEKFCISLNPDVDLEKLEQILCNDATVLPGSMTPLRKHIPSASFGSIFHLRDVQSVRQLILPTPQLQMHKSRKQLFTPVVDASRRKSPPFDIESLYGPMLRNYYTITWKRGKRNYLEPKPDPWPPHSFHVVDSAMALDIQDFTPLS